MESSLTILNDEINEGIIILRALKLICLDTNNKLFLSDEGKKIAERIIEGRQIILRPPQERRTSIFIASAFGHEELDLLYKNEFIKACEVINCKPCRVDLTEPHHTITDAVIRGISEAKCIIADLTYARPSVYFEVGFAHGLGVPLILTCCQDHQKGSNENQKVHFDLEQYKISYWNMVTKGMFSWTKNMNPIERLQTLFKD